MRWLLWTCERDGQLLSLLACLFVCCYCQSLLLLECPLVSLFFCFRLAPNAWYLELCRSLLLLVQPLSASIPLAQSTGASFSLSLSLFFFFLLRTQPTNNLLCFCFVLIFRARNEQASKQVLRVCVFEEWRGGGMVALLNACLAGQQRCQQQQGSLWCQT